MCADFTDLFHHCSHRWHQYSLTSTREFVSSSLAMLWRYCIKAGRNERFETSGRPTGRGNDCCLCQNCFANFALPLQSLERTGKTTNQWWLGRSKIRDTMLARQQSIRKKILKGNRSERDIECGTILVESTYLVGNLSTRIVLASL
jgi:hypothetical protein